MNLCNRCKRKRPRLSRATSGEKGPRTRAERGETGRDESREVRAEQLLGRSQPSLRRSIVELQCREDARRARRSPSHTIDCNAAHTAEDGAESAVWAGTGGATYVQARVRGGVAVRGAERRRGLGRRSAARASGGTLGAASAASCRQRSARRCLIQRALANLGV